MEFRPAPANSGLVFVRSDLPGAPRIRALANHRVEVPRRTVLEQDGVQVEMVEHILAGLAGLRIDNCEIVVDGSEMPADDGSSRFVVEALCDAGWVRQLAPRCAITLQETVRVGTDEMWIEARPMAERGLKLHYDLEYPVEAIGRQSRGLTITPLSFCRQLAAARTFLLESEAQELAAAGIGRNFGFSDLLVFGPDGPINNRVRYVDECVRHKILDLIGDLALIGLDLHAEIFAFKSGHRLNVALAAEIRDRYLAQSRSLLLSA